MRTKAQTTTKDSKEKTPGVSSSRSRNRGYDDYDTDIKDYDEENFNRTEDEFKKTRKGRKKYRKKSK